MVHGADFNRDLLSVQGSRPLAEPRHALCHVPSRCLYLPNCSLIPKPIVYREIRLGRNVFATHSPNFDAISTSGDVRAGDLYAMIDPRLREVIEEEGIMLTTWRELHERRAQLDGE